MIGDRTGEQVKLAIGSAYPGHTMEIRGRDLVTGAAEKHYNFAGGNPRALDEPITCDCGRN